MGRRAVTREPVSAPIDRGASASDEPAWLDPATRRSWRRDRRVGRVWLVITVVALSMFFVIVIRQSNHVDWLKAHGTRVQGVVLSDPPQALRCGQVPVPIRFNGDV